MVVYSRIKGRMPLTEVCFSKILLFSENSRQTDDERERELEEWLRRAGVSSKSYGCIERMTVHTSDVIKKRSSGLW